MKISIFLLSIILLPHFSYSQDVIIKKAIYGNDSIPILLKFDLEGKCYSKGEESKIWKKYFKSKPEDEFKKTKSRYDKKGNEHIVYHQYYKNIKVEYSTLHHHLKGDVIYSLNGNCLKIEDFDVSQKIMGQEALQNALSELNSTQYAWEVEEMEIMKKKNEDNLNATYFPIGELVLWNPYRENRVHLAYKFKIFSITAKFG